MRTPIGIAIAVATRTIRAVPRIAGPIPVGFAGEEEVEADRLGAAGDDRVGDDAQHGDRGHGGGGRAALGDAADDAAPAQVARRRSAARSGSKPALAHFATLRE